MRYAVANASYQVLNSLVMLLEDFGGESLKGWTAKRQLTLEEILSVSIKIAESLGSIHAANIIHKDINHQR